MTDKKYQIERASENSEALFLLCTNRPKFRAKVHTFDNHVQSQEFHAENSLIQQVRKLPIYLEVVEIEENYKPNQLKRSLKNLSDWYYYSMLYPSQQ